MEIEETSVESVDMDAPENASLDDAPKNGLTVDPSERNVLHFVEDKFQKAKQGRYDDELRMLLAYRNFRGRYGPDVQFTETEKSRVFVKTTKVKVLAAYGSIIEVLLLNNTFPLTVDPTTLPEGVAEAVHFDTQDAPDGAKLDSLPELAPGETRSVYDRIGEALKSKLAPVKDKLKEGEGQTPTAITIHPAKIAAKKMEKKIKDQIEESGGTKELRKFAFDLALLGTGVMEGPFAVEKEYPRWGEDGVYDPIRKMVPRCSHVSVWDFYPDPDSDSMETAEYIIRRRKASRSTLRGYKSRSNFRSNAIDKAIELGESYIEEHWESSIADGDAHQPNERFQVLEFWGYMDSDKVTDFGVEVEGDTRSVQVNAWTCNGQVLRLVVNPFQPALMPYFACPYEMNPGSFFGVGVGENMEDSQILMNGFMRMGVDNAALSGNLIFEVDESNLVPGQDMDVYPGKKFIRQGGAPGQAIFGTKFPNVAQENMMMFDKARQLADESTGIPSVSHGQTGVQGIGRSAAGYSMLLGAASGNIKPVIKNVDDYLLAPMGKAYFQFNMQYDHDPEIKGDLEVKAQGTQSLMANEVRSQRLMQFLSIVQNPALAPFAKMDYIIREIASSMDLDPDKVTNNLADAAIFAEIMKQFAPAESAAPPPTEGGPPSVNDAQGTGNGNIGVGSVPVPGEDQFGGPSQ